MTKYTRHSGFTMVEMLVTMGIIVALIAIVVPVIVIARGKVGKARIAADLQAISTGLEAYYADFRAYPVVYSGNPLPAPPPNYDYFDSTGAQVLCRAMIGPGPNIPPSTTGPDGTPDFPAERATGYDGNDGPGFRTKPGKSVAGGWNGTDDVKATGRVYGPYLQPEKFIIDNDDDRTNAVIYGRAVLRTYDGNEILYFPANARKPNLAANKGFISSRTIPLEAATAGSLFQADDNLRYFTDPENIDVIDLTGAPAAAALERIRLMLGDNRGYTGTAPYGDGNITSGTETAVSTGPYLLWAAGDDGRFGPVTADKNGVAKCDDVTNFTFAP